MNLCEVGPITRWIQVAQSRIARHAEAGATCVNCAKRLMVGEVEHIPPRLEVVFLAPRHLPRLCKAEVSIHVRGQAKVISRSALTGISVAEALVNCFFVTRTKELWRTSPANTYGTVAGSPKPLAPLFKKVPYLHLPSFPSLPRVTSLPRASAKGHESSVTF